MNEGYLKYLKAIRNKNPMSESQWKEAIGIVDDVERHDPIEIRPKKDARTVKATFDNFLYKG